MNGFSFIAKLRNKIRVKPNNNIQIGKNTRIRCCDIYVNGENNQLIIHDRANLKGVTIEALWKQLLTGNRGQLCNR